jgi:hypothetical protein
MASKLRTITVADLKRLLDGEEDDALVIFSTDYGDYHHTPQALGLRGETEEVFVEESAYSNSGFAVQREEDLDDDELDEAENDEDRKFLLIR